MSLSAFKTLSAILFGASIILACMMLEAGIGITFGEEFKSFKFALTLVVFLASGLLALKWNSGLGVECSKVPPGSEVGLVAVLTVCAWIGGILIKYPELVG